MSEETGGMLALAIAVLGKVWYELIIGNAAGLWKAVHAFVDFDIDIAIVN
jgi:hypothetical protein